MNRILPGKLKEFKDILSRGSQRSSAINKEKNVIKVHGTHRTRKIYRLGAQSVSGGIRKLGKYYRKGSDHERPG